MHLGQQILLQTQSQPHLEGPCMVSDVEMGPSGPCSGPGLVSLGKPGSTIIPTATRDWRRAMPGEGKGHRALNSCSLELPWLAIEIESSSPPD